MAGTPVDVGTGTTITAGTSSWTASLTRVNHSGIERVSLDTSHMGTAAPGAGKFGNRTFVPGDLSDPGTLEIEAFFNPDTEPPVDQVAETWTVTFPLFAGDATPATWAASGFAVSFGFDNGLEELMTIRMDVKLSGNITMVAAA